MAAGIDSSSHFTLEEIRDLLDSDKYNCNTFTIPNRWKKINDLRAEVAPALTQGLFELLFPRVKENQPLIELGSGVGYSFSEELSKRVIKTQPSIFEGRDLQNQTSDPVYRLNILNLCNRLSQSGKNVPLFFALNVFDTMSKDERMSNLTHLSKLQEKGDKIVVMLDVNPFLNTMFDELFEQYPNHGIWPYFDPEKSCHKLSVVIIPTKYAENPPKNCIELCKLFDKCTKDIDNTGRASSASEYMRLQQTHNCKIITLEDYYAEQVKGQLEELGYEARSFYHSAYVIDRFVREGPLTYKPITDYPHIRDWSVQDENLLEFLSSKGLDIPDDIKKIPVSDLRERNLQIFGAEFLVIEGTKQSFQQQMPRGEP